MDKDKLITLGAGAVLTTLVTLVITEVRTVVEPKWLMFSVYLLFSLFASSMGLIAYFRAETNLKESEQLHKTATERLEAVEGSLKYVRNAVENRTELSWILSTEQMLVLEREKENSKDIWIVTDDLADDTGDSPWVAVIQNNIADGIAYIYICPEALGVSSAINGLKNVFRGALGQCRFAKIPAAELDQLPYRHIVVYDPGNEAGEMDALCEIDAEQKGWWLRISAAKRNVVIDSVRTYASKATPLE